MKMKSNWMKKIIAYILTFVISFCAFTKPVHAVLNVYELVSWDTCLACLKGCKYDFYKNQSTYTLAEGDLGTLRKYVNLTQYYKAYDFIGHIYI